jgi:hypothetical protein
VTVWRRLLLGCALVALAVAGVALAATFSDPVGDTYGPDIDSVELKVDGGNLDINVHFSNVDNGLEDAALAEIDVDLDGNAATGDDGIDLYAVYEGGQPNEVLRFEKNDYVDTTAAHATKTNDGVQLRVPLSLVGRTVKASVQAIAPPPPDQDPNNPITLPTGPDTDVAPDTGVYTLAIARPTLKGATVAYSPAQPRAGKLFAVRKVSLLLSSGGPFAASTSCTATLAGKKLGPANACAWRIPANARGKSLRVTVTATFAGTAFKLPAKTFAVR